MSDILGIIVDIILACVIAQILERNINNTRVEKDYFINELDVVSGIFTELDRVCSRETCLSLANITYDLSRSRKILARMWKMMEEVEKAYCKPLKGEYDDLFKSIKLLDKQLTDTTTFKSIDGFQPIKIVKNHIYINSTVKPNLDATISEIKERLLRLKIGVNKR